MISLDLKKTNMLSDSKIRNLKPSEKCTPSRPDKYSDQQGLQLLVRNIVDTL